MAGFGPQEASMFEFIGYLFVVSLCVMLFVCAIAPMIQERNRKK